MPTDNMATLIGALAKALPELDSAKKNKANPHFKAKYADLGAIIEAIEPVKAHGLWYRQVAHENENGAMIETFYIHESGEQLSAGVQFMPAAKRDAQGFGSALTYCRRYGLQTAFGLATEDDDGNAAVKPPPPPELIIPESVKLFLNGLRASFDDGTTVDYWKTNYPGVPKEWLAYVIEQKELIKAAQSNVALLAAG